MTIRDILKMGDPRLLRVAQAVTRFDADEMHLMLDTVPTLVATGPKT